MQEAGIPNERIKFIKGPAGLDIGATTAAEIALSMIGEVISAKRGTLTWVRFCGIKESGTWKSDFQHLLEGFHEKGSDPVFDLVVSE